jgi:GNAT superfamily N-acetyltransferase
VQGARRVSLLQKDFWEIEALIVAESARGFGLGKQLMLGSFKLAADHGITTLRLRSNVKRTDAHKFYEPLGFKVTSTSHKFEYTNFL